MKSNKKRIIYIIGIVVLIIVAIGLIANLSIADIYEYEVTEDQINSELEEVFPVSKTFLNILTLSLGSASVQLNEGSDRMLVSLNASVSLNTSGTVRSFSGTINISTGVEYNPESGEVLLEDPEVESLHFDNFPEKDLKVLTAIVNIIVGVVLDGYPIYVLEPEDIPTDIAKLLLNDVTIEDGHVVLKFGF
jgi:hypothetical protein